MTEDQKQMLEGVEKIKSQLRDLINLPYLCHDEESHYLFDKYGNDANIVVSKDSEDIAVIKLIFSYHWYMEDYPVFAAKARAKGLSYAIVYSVDEDDMEMQDLRESRSSISCFVKIASLKELTDVMLNGSEDIPTQIDWKMKMEKEIEFVRDLRYFYGIKSIEHLQKSRVTFDAKTMRCSVSNKDEHAFFKGILGNYEKDEICRYTTFDTLERILKDKKQSVCSVVCMNDKTECYYADDYIEQHSGLKPEQLLETNCEELNKSQISSCTHIELADELSLWRMYADDAKGVCLKFRIRRDLLAKKGFYLYCMSYGSDDKHWALDMISHMREMRIMGYQFEFKMWPIWKHFFKPVHYRDEREVRLLYFKKKKDTFKWIKTCDSHILAPVIEFGIEKGKNEFPLVLSEIILGPKFPEAETNVVQIKYLKELQKIEEENGCPVRLSKIKGYR